MDKQIFTLAELADKLQLEYHGDGNTIIRGIAPLYAAGPDQISFLDNAKYRRYLEGTKAAAVILSSGEAPACPTAALIAEHPYYIYAKVAECFAKRFHVQPGIHASAVIGNGCQIDPSASIGAHVVIGDQVVIQANAQIGPGCVLGEGVSIGEHSCLQANVSVYHAVQIGQRVIVHSGAVIGSDGFGFAKDKGYWHKVPQLGGVIVGDDVEIGANTTIDRGALDNTYIGNNVKLDNQVQVAHNVKIGEHAAIAGCVAIAGSAQIGKDCMIGGGAGIAGHLTIADNAAVSGFAGVTKSINKPGVYSGMPAQLDAQWKRGIVHLRKLDKTLEKVKRLEQQVNSLLLGTEADEYERN